MRPMTKPAVNQSAPSGPLAIPFGQHPFVRLNSLIVSLCACRTDAEPDNTNNNKHCGIVTMSPLRQIITDYAVTKQSIFLRGIYPENLAVKVR